jgi:hypothetical protein
MFEARTSGCDAHGNRHQVVETEDEGVLRFGNR